MLTSQRGVTGRQSGLKGSYCGIVRKWVLYNRAQRTSLGRWSVGALMVQPLNSPCRCLTNFSVCLKNAGDTWVRADFYVKQSCFKSILTGYSVIKGAFFSGGWGWGKGRGGGIVLGAVEIPFMKTSFIILFSWNRCIDNF